MSSTVWVTLKISAKKNLTESRFQGRTTEVISVQFFPPFPQVYQCIESFSKLYPMPMSYLELTQEGDIGQVGGMIERHLASNRRISVCARKHHGPYDGKAIYLLPKKIQRSFRSNIANVQIPNSGSLLLSEEFRR